jgi:hypothetical protein
MGKKNWLPSTLELDDLRQEAYVAVLEAQASGIIDPTDLQRLAETCLRRLIAQEKRYTDREESAGLLNADDDL